jgi:hypothetical protein
MYDLITYTVSCDLGLYPVNKGSHHLILYFILEPSGTMVQYRAICMYLFVLWWLLHVYKQEGEDGYKPGLDLLSSQSIHFLHLGLAFIC